ncbi:MAG: hypothetical protein AABX79_02125 [Nanoarchaeota archaeon]
MANKRGIIALIVLPIFLMVFAIQMVSAKVIINTQPNPVYNLGDTVPVSVTLTSPTAASGFLEMTLICGANKIIFYRNPMSLTANEPKNVESSLILEKVIIEELKGTCSIKASLGADSASTADFEISDLIIIQSNVSKTEFNPGESIFVEGNAVKENRDSANGYAELSILDGNSTILIQQGTMNNGLFSLNISLPKETKSGNYLLRITAYEQDLQGGVTNTGSKDQNIYIKQVPTSLEIVFETQDVEPGTNLRVKAVLYDQTGDKIDSNAFLTIKNNKSKILEQTEKRTDEFLEFPIAYNEGPFYWTVVSVSNKLTAESNFKILENESASIEIINNTVLITNTGNVPYNKTVLVKIGSQPFNINAYIKVGNSGRWVLTAPDGKYDIIVNADGQITGASIALTGDSIDVKKASAAVGSLVKFPAIWIFVLAILGFVAFIFFKRGYQKAFIGYISSGIQKKSHGQDKPQDYIYGPKSNKAELALSIKGDKQDVSMVTLKIKNMAAIEHSHDKEGSAGEMLKKVIDVAESHKAATYKDHDSIFFIFAPARTKTFHNEENALRVSQRIKEILEEHNRLFKQRADFGISLNYGTIIGKQEQDSFKFMGLGSIMTQSKKIAAASNGEILMGEKMTDKLRNIVKTEKHKRDGLEVYAIKEIKNYEQHQKFLRGFMKRMEK